VGSSNAAFEPAGRPLGEALALGEALLARSAANGVSFLAASLVRGPAVILGAAQLAGRVLDLDACRADGVAVHRRVTAGTAAYVGEHAILWTLVLRHVAALFPDATPRTLLNRNVRGFLEGLTRAVGLAHYFGREWVSVQRRPAALLGFERRGAAVLVEVIAGVEAPVAIPQALTTKQEREVDRWRGKAPAGLCEMTERDVAAIARDVMLGVAGRAHGPLMPAPTMPLIARSEVAGPDDPLPSGYARGPALRVPIGWIDTGIEPASRQVWLGGDVLVPADVRAAVANGEPELGEVPVEGAKLADLREAVRLAQG